jgi:DUF4097 and DUF4098 domain-containing protein YvlB
MASTTFTGWTIGAAMAVLTVPASPSVTYAAGAPRAIVLERDQNKNKEKDKNKNDNENQDRDRDRERDRGTDQERITKRFKVGATGSLLLTNVSGDIQITGGPGSEIVIDAVKHARSRGGDDGRQQLQNLDVSIQETAGRVEVRTYHRGKNDRSWVDYVVSVPSGARVDVQSVSGEVQVSRVQGETRAESVSGNVTATALGRVTQVKSVSGDVEVTNSQSDSELTISTVSGNIRGSSIKARGILVNSVSGDSLLRGCECGRAQLKSVSGTVEYSGPLAQGGRYEANVHSGDIRFMPSGPVGYELEASTFSGDIRTEGPIKVTSMSRNRGPGRSVHGVAGNGGAFIDLSSFSGDIVVGVGGK